MRIQNVIAYFHGSFIVQTRDQTSRVTSTCRGSDGCNRASKCREVQSFLGLKNFSARFIPNLAGVAKPLHRLTRKDIPFVWGAEQHIAFDSLKSSGANAETLVYFGSNAEETKLTDANPVGLGAVLTQVQEACEWVIASASQSLTDVERRYS